MGATPSMADFKIFRESPGYFDVDGYISLRRIEIPKSPRHKMGEV
jgi:hypothetical protein